MESLEWILLAFVIIEGCQLFAINWAVRAIKRKSERLLDHITPEEGESILANMMEGVINKMAEDEQFRSNVYAVIGGGVVAGFGAIQQNVSKGGGGAIDMPDWASMLPRKYQKYAPIIQLLGGSLTKNKGGRPKSDAGSNLDYTV